MKKTSDNFKLFLKLFLYNITIVILIAPIIFFILEVILYRKTPTNINEMLSDINWSLLIFISILGSVLNLSAYKTTIERVKTSGTGDMVCRINEYLIKKRWKLEKEEKNEAIYTAPLYICPWREKISVKIEDDTVSIEGPSLYVDKIKQKLKIN